MKKKFLYAIRDTKTNKLVNCKCGKNGKYYEMVAFANGFKTLKLTPAKTARLPYALGMHVHVGTEYEE